MLQSVYCEACVDCPNSFVMSQDVVQKIQDIIDANKTFEDFEEVFILSCTVVLDATFEKGHVMCPGLVASYGPVVSEGGGFVCCCMEKHFVNHISATISFRLTHTHTHITTYDPSYAADSIRA